VLELSPPRGLGERLLALHRFPLFSVLPPAELTQLARLSRDRELAAGAELASEGRPVSAAHLVLSGRVDLWRAGRLVRACQPFEIAELPTLAAGLSSPFTLRAAESIHALEIEAGPLVEVLEDDFDLFVEVLRAAARAAPGARVFGGARGGASGAGRRRAWTAGPGRVASFDAAERLIALRETDLFRRAPVDGLAALARRLEVAPLGPGDPVDLSGPGEQTVVVEGAVTVPAGPSVQALDPCVVGPGSVLGLREALAGDPPLAGVRAASPVVLLRGPLADLLDVLDDHHAMGRQLMAALATLSVSSS